MVILSAVIAVVLVVLAFTAGMITADRFNRRASYDTQIALQKQYARLMAGIDADNAVQPYVYAPPYKQRYSVSPEFVDRLRTNGSATESLKSKQAC